MCQELSEKIRKSFSDAVVLTFQKTALVACAPVADLPGNNERAFDYSAVIGFSGDIAGSCVLRMSIQTACEAVARFCGERVDDLWKISDGVGELVNMIAGNAKATLSNFRMSLSFPEVVRGKGHDIGFRRNADLVELNFGSEIGDISVIVAYFDPVKKN